MRKRKIIWEKWFSLPNRWHCHPEGSAIPFQWFFHKYGYHFIYSSNDNTIFLLDYLYYSVYEVGCRWFFDHNWLMFVYTYIYLLTTNSLLHLRLLYTKFYSSEEKQFTYPSSETTIINILLCLLFCLSIYLIAELYLAPLDILVFFDFFPSKIVPIE